MAAFITMTKHHYNIETVSESGLHMITSMDTHVRTLIMHIHCLYAFMVKNELFKVNSYQKSFTCQIHKNLRIWMGLVVHQVFFLDL